MISVPLPYKSLQVVLGNERSIEATRMQGEGAVGKLPLTRAMLLQEPSGGAWHGAVYNVEKIIAAIDAGLAVLGDES